MADWHYKAGDAEHGPVSWARIQELWRSGEINGETLIRRGDGEGWKTIAEATGTGEAAEPAPEGGDPEAEASMPEAAAGAPEAAAGMPEAPAQPAPDPAPPAFDLSRLDLPGLEESSWYFQDGKGVAGPVPWQRFREIAGAGRISADTLVQLAGTPSWQPLGALLGEAAAGAGPVAAPARRDPPPAAAKAAPAAAPPVGSAPPAGAAAVVDADGWSNLPATPWRRFFADGFDVLVNGVTALFLLVMVLARVAPAVAVGFLQVLTSPAGEFVFAVAVCALAALLNAWWIARFGTTPGKALLGLRIRRADLSRLSFGLALNRQIRQVFLGNALGIVPMIFVTWIVGYVKLRRNGVTPWDRECGTVVLCRPRGGTELAGAIGRYMLGLLGFCSSTI